MKSPTNPDPTRDEELEALMCDCLNLFLSTLPLEQANLVRAVDVEGELLQSVADSHGLSLNKATMQLALGRQGLRERFAEMRMICSQHGLEGCDCRSTGDADT